MTTQTHSDELTTVDELAALEEGDTVTVTYESTHGENGNEQTLTGDVTRVEVQNKDLSPVAWVEVYINSDDDHDHESDRMLDVSAYEGELVTYDLKNRNGARWTRLNSLTCDPVTEKHIGEADPDAREEVEVDLGDEVHVDFTPADDTTAALAGEKEFVGTVTGIFTSAGELIVQVDHVEDGWPQGRTYDCAPEWVTPVEEDGEDDDSEDADAELAADGGDVKRRTFEYENEAGNVRVRRVWANDGDQVWHADIERQYNYQEGAWIESRRFTRTYDLHADGETLKGDGSGWSGAGRHWADYAEDRHHKLLGLRFPHDEIDQQDDTEGDTDSDPEVMADGGVNIDHALDHVGGELTGLFTDAETPAAMVCYGATFRALRPVIEREQESAPVVMTDGGRAQRSLSNNGQARLTDFESADEDEEDEEEHQHFDPEAETVTDAWEGTFIYCSWGYNQTNVDIARIIEVSDSGKTVLCKGAGAERVEAVKGSEQLRPTAETYGDEFRLHVREAAGDPVFRGSYPLGSSWDEDNGTRKGSFFPWSKKAGATVHQTPTNQGH